MEPWWRIGSAFVAGALLEVSTHPKPGLVTARSNGAHRDMSLRTFLVSTAAITPCFYQCAEAGWNHVGDPTALLPLVREIGRDYEAALLRATGGVNTQRGLLFSAGILSAAAGLLSRRNTDLTADALFQKAAAMTRGLCDRELSRDRAPATAGERLFVRYGARGIRGEVEDGFPTLSRAALPALAEARAVNAPIERALIHVLISLIAETEDTTVLWRGGPRALEWLRAEARAVLDAGGALTSQGLEAIHRLDAACIDRGISPGGSADLLAVTVGVQTLVDGALTAFGVAGSAVSARSSRAPSYTRTP
ncbi:triphosphoribosyl-dephospho-CoA synthase MdcB [Roseospira marina]|uniref:triphosphoribosyl-dephospho-CoA synthase MdcB n=1 Tax=Roseospira marina TaxID=140057 RepID=UPI0021A56E92|nr:triphosphoribosyl-dephospho-CoA synthase MdcB [Roseospira marina]